MKRAKKRGTGQSPERSDGRSAEREASSEEGKEKEQEETREERLSVCMAKKVGEVPVLSDENEATTTLSSTPRKTPQIGPEGVLILGPHILSKTATQTVVPNHASMSPEAQVIEQVWRQL